MMDFYNIVERELEEAQSSVFPVSNESIASFMSPRI
jgi:hypothetical protein